MGRSCGSTTSHAARSWRMASSWPTQVTVSSSGCARCRGTPSISTTICTRIAERRDGLGLHAAENRGSDVRHRMVWREKHGAQKTACAVEENSVSKDDPQAEIRRLLVSIEEPDRVRAGCWKASELDPLSVQLLRSAMFDITPPCGPESSRSSLPEQQVSPRKPEEREPCAVPCPGGRGCPCAR